MSPTFRDPASVSTHASPPGAYWYQMGTVSGPRPGPADTDKAAMCGSAKNSWRSRADSLLSAMARAYARAPTVHRHATRTAEPESANVPGDWAEVCRAGCG